jgi:chromosomal replication initiator protein
MDAFWTLCLQHFEQSLPPQQFRTWIQPLQAHREGGSLVLAAPNRFVLQWVKDRFLPVIEQLARDRNERASVQLELTNGSPAGLVSPLTPAALPATVDGAKPAA